MHSKTILIFIFVFLLWALYRYQNLANPLWFEETVVKGVVFSLPLLLFPPIRKPLLSAVGMTRHNFLHSVYLGITLGMILGLAGQIGNFIRHGELSFNSFGLTSGTIGAFLILSLITAFWEQLLFSGYFVAKLQSANTPEVPLVLLVGLGFSLIHLPALLLDPNAASQIVINLLLLFSLGVSCAILRLRLKNLIAPIMAHALWGVTVFLFR